MQVQTGSVCVAVKPQEAGTSQLSVCEAELGLTFMLQHQTGSGANLIVDINA